MLLMIDNYDSFTYNLVQYLGELGAEVQVFRNDGITIGGIEAFAGKIPILGVCLGHQSIGQVFGGRIVHAREVMHGKTSPIYHADTGVFTGLDYPFEATRYHSLVIERNTLPDCLEITAWTQRDGALDEIMGVRHKELDVQGVQFHPESILTQHGHDLLRNFIEGR
jgi:anthranilate synthase component 2